MTAPVTSPLRDFAEAAAFLGVGEHHLRKAVARREYPHTRIGRKVRFSEDDLTRIIAMGHVEPRQSAASLRLAHTQRPRRTGT